MSEVKNIETPASLASLSLDDSVDEKNIHLLSKEGKKFEISKRDAKVSDLVSKSFETDTESTELPLPSVETEMLELIVEYMKYHKGEEPPIVEKPLRSSIMKDVCKDEWDATFIDKVGDSDLDKLYELIKTANYMNIKSLLHLGCAKVASKIKGKPVDEVKKILRYDEVKREETKEENN